MIYWLTFTDGTRGSCGGDNYEAAKQKAEEVSGKEVQSGELLPYFARPVIWQPEGKHGPMPAFCYQPERCKGRGSCPTRPSCVD